MRVRLAGFGFILLLTAWAVTGMVSAEETTPLPTITPGDIVITDDIEPYFGPMGPGSPLYGLKLALENLDEAFTFNQGEKVMKQMDHAELRISEIKGLLLMNKSVEAERALDAYFEKMNLTALDLSSIPVRTTGIANAYEQHVRHQLALRDLLEAHPNSTKLWQAYNHTLSLEGRFMEKSQVRIEKRVGQLNRITAKIVSIADGTGDGDQESPAATATQTSVPITPGHGLGKEKQAGKDTGAAPVTTQTATPSPDDGSGRDRGKEKNGKGPK